MWSGRVNSVISEIASTLTPGTALDLGCGEGGDAVWLAEQGWQVTGVDISPTAVKRGTEAAKERGITSPKLNLIAADLGEWHPDGQFDLVTCSFLHSFGSEFNRDKILAAATGFVAPGGHMLITAHAAPLPWMNPEMAAAHEFPSPVSELQVLGVDEKDWQILIAETRTREATGPDGTSGVVTDSVVLLKRR
jgi:2-polyprenyl-3-methyl-5-hydroxy-6-metoxy-1,4-benzoquinol methylase